MIKNWLRKLFNISESNWQHKTKIQNMNFVATYSKGGKELERRLAEFPGHNVLVRLGGHLRYPDFDIQINTTEGVVNCIHKDKMKRIFLDNGIKTLPMIPLEKAKEFPFVIKGAVRSQGKAVYVVENENELKVYRKILREQFYIEPLFNTTSEYRVHCTKDKVFFSVKKLKKPGFENDIIVNGNNHKNVRDFLKPRLWKELQEECVKAMNAVGLDIGAVDVGYDSSNNNKHKFVIHEINTNPELLENTLLAYKSEIEEMVNKRIKNERRK